MSGFARTAWLAAAVASACDGEPVYLSPTPAAVEVVGAGNAGTASVVVPVRIETEAQLQARLELAMQLGVGPGLVPSVRRDEIDLQLDWTIKNLSDQEGTAVLTVVAANELFSYDPALFVVDIDDEGPPPLLGGIPTIVPPLGTVSGVFREDQLAEAAQDLDALTRWGFTPERAILDHWDDGTIVDDAGMLLAPSLIIPALLRIDVTFDANQHMVLEYTLRVRDRTNRLAPYEDEFWMLVTPAAGGAFMPPVAP